MQWIVERSLTDFEFWSGAKARTKYLTYSELKTLDDVLGFDVFGGEIPTETEINDLFWFEEDTIAQYLGYADWDELMNNRDE